MIYTSTISDLLYEIDGLARSANVSRILDQIDRKVLDMQQTYNELEGRAYELENRVDELEDSLSWANKEQKEEYEEQVKELERAMDWLCEELERRSFEHPLCDYDQRISQQWKEEALNHWMRD